MMLLEAKLSRTTLFAAALMLCAAHASANTWTGLGTSSNWSNADNWSGGVPVSGDIVVFDATSAKDCAIDQNISVSGIQITADYAGVISQGSSTITVGAGDFTQDGGTFAGGSGAITINGSFYQNGGSFTSTSGRLRINMSTAIARGFIRTGGTFAHNNGEIYFASVSNGQIITLTTAGCTMYNLTLDYASGTTANTQPTDSFTVDNDLRIFGQRSVGTSSPFSPPAAITVTVLGDLRKEDGSNVRPGNSSLTILMSGEDQTFVCGNGGFNGKVHFQGTGTHIITNDVATAASARGVYYLHVDKPNGDVRIFTDVMAYRLRVESGNTIDGGGNNIWPSTTAGAIFIRNYGTITNTDPNWTFSIPASGTLALYSGSFAWSNITVAADNTGTASVTLEDDITINGNLLFSGPYRSSFFLGAGRTITINGDFVIRHTNADNNMNFAENTSTVRLAGLQNQFMSMTANRMIYRPDTVIESGAVVTLTNSLTSQRAVTVEAGGELDLFGSNLSAGTGVTVSGTLRRKGGETVTAPTLNPGSMVIYEGSESPVTVNNWSYKELAFHAPGRQFDWTAGATYTAAESFSVEGTKPERVVFRSTVEDTSWMINIENAAIDVKCVDVKDSTAVNGEIVTTGSKDSGNNVNWRFGSRALTVTIR